MWLSPDTAAAAAVTVHVSPLHKWKYRPTPHTHTHTHTHTSSHRAACQSAVGRLKTVDVYQTFRQSSVTSDLVGECPPRRHRQRPSTHLSPSLYSLPPQSLPRLRYLPVSGDARLLPGLFVLGWNLRKSTFVSVRSSCLGPEWGLKKTHFHHFSFFSNNDEKQSPPPHSSSTQSAHQPARCTDSLALVLRKC